MLACIRASPVPTSAPAFTYWCSELILHAFPIHLQIPTHPVSTPCQSSASCSLNVQAVVISATTLTATEGGAAVTTRISLATRPVSMPAGSRHGLMRLCAPSCVLTRRSRSGAAAAAAKPCRQTLQHQTSKDQLAAITVCWLCPNSSERGAWILLAAGPKQRWP